VSEAMIETPAVDEMTALEARASEAAQRAREKAERVEHIKTQKAELESKAEEDGADIVALGAAVATLSGQLPMAEASYRVAERDRVDIEGQLAVIRRTRTVARIDASRAGIEGTAGENAAAVLATLGTLSGLCAARLGIEAEMEACRRQLALYGVSAAPVPRLHDILDEACRTLRARGRHEVFEVRLPVAV